MKGKTTNSKKLLTLFLCSCLHFSLYALEGKNNHTNTFNGETEETVTTILLNNYQTFYVDQINGNDSNNGLSPTTAWKSLSKVNTSHWQYDAGDSILFHTDQTWEGQLELNNLDGIDGLPIVITSYGKGKKPHLAGQGQKDWTVKLQNCHYTIFKGFEITNMGTSPKGWRYAIELRANNAGEIYGTVISHNDIHDVNGQQDKSLQQGGAILIKNTGSVRSRLVNAVIEYNHIYDVVRNGIYGNYNFGLDDPFRNKNIIIRKNLIERIPGDAIVAFGLENAVVEYNICRDFTPLLDAPNNAAAGIWAFNSTNTIIQHNEVSGHQAKHDGQGYDADFNCENTIIQYNYSFNNVGGFALVCSDGSQSTSFNRNPILRYNLSIGDGFRTDGVKYANKAPTFHITGNVEGAKIYNNTIYASQKPESVVKEFVKFDNWFAHPNATEIKNNTFFGVEEMAVVIGNSTYTVVDHNAYYGGTNVPEDENAFYGERTGNEYATLLEEPGTVEGASILNNGGQDFFGNPVTTNQIGAFVTPSNNLQLKQPISSTSLALFSQNTLSSTIIQVTNIIDEVFITEEMSLTSGDNPIDISMLEPGMYWLDVIQGNLTTRLKFIKVEEIIETPPAEFLTFFDPLLNLNLTETYHNAVIYSGGSTNFNDDEGRFSRVNIDTGYIVYHIPNLVDFEVEYWSWVWAGNGSMHVYGSTDGLNYTPINTQNENESVIGDRTYTIVKAENDQTAEQYNYLKIELSGGDFNWKDQIGSVRIFHKENNTIAVNGVSLDQSISTISAGSTLQLNASITPSNATNQNIVWSSSDPSIISVDGNGLVIGIKGGESIIQAQTEEGGFIATSTVRSITSGSVKAPTNLHFETTETTVTINWDAHENATWHTISYRLPPSSWVTIDSIPNKEINTYNLVDLTPNSTYNFRIRSHSATNSVGWTNTTFTTSSSQNRMKSRPLEEDLEMLVYPNPTSNFLYIKGLKNKERIRILNISGQLIDEKIGVQKIDVSKYNKGIYILQIENQTPQKFIKK